MSFFPKFQFDGDGGNAFYWRILLGSRISMDRILASEAGDPSSNLGGSAIFLYVKDGEQSPRFFFYDESEKTL